MAVWYGGRWKTAYTPCIIPLGKTDWQIGNLAKGWTSNPEVHSFPTLSCDKSFPASYFVMAL